MIELICAICIGIFIAILACAIGYIKGFKDCIEIDRSYDKKFEDLVIDFITGNFERKK